MTIEEDRLATWLRRETPDPPRRLVAENIWGPTAQSHNRARWAPLLAAASVAAAVAGLAVGLSSMHHTPSQATMSQPGATAGPWPVRTLGTGAHPEYGDVATDGKALFASSPEVSQSPFISRVDARTGGVTARASVDWPLLNSRFIAAGGRIWSISVSGSSVVLSGYDATTLKRSVVRLHLQGSTGSSQPATSADLSAPADGSALYVSTGREIAVIDPFKGASRAQCEATAGRAPRLASRSGDPRRGLLDADWAARCAGLLAGFGRRRTVVDFPAPRCYGSLSRWSQAAGTVRTFRANGPVSVSWPARFTSGGN